MRRYWGTIVSLIGLLAIESFAMSCKGTIYFQPPASWGDDVYVVGCAQFYKASKGASGWYEITGAAATAAGVCSNDFKFTNSSNWNGTWLSTIGTNEGQIDGKPFNCSEIPGDLYIQEDPNNPGKTWLSVDPPNAKYFYVLLPEEKDWMVSTPMLSLDGSEKNSVELKPDPSRCGWYYYVYFNQEPSDESYIFLKEDHEQRLGNGKLGLKTKFADNKTDVLFYDPVEEEWTVIDGGKVGSCSYSIAALIYDTDAFVNDLFSEYQGVYGPYTETCIGVRKGIVKDVLGPDNKPQLNVGSPNATACFGGNEALFNSLFNYTPGKNEVTCYDLPFTREADGRWGYNSDLAVTGTTTGGFYPVENTTDANIVTLNGVTMGPLPAARMKRSAEGPVDVASVPKGIADIDHVCNGPGWDGGIDCEGLFVTGDEIGGVTWQWDMSPTGGVRWGSQTRNQHFCFESHASFTYQPNQQFSFRGDDDIWVFIAGKLAVDNGGAHLAAPGHVVLSQITDAMGRPLVPGQEYNLDIFFCDRRTTMSNVIIKTNMFIKQKSSLGLSATTGKNPDGSTKYELCWDETSDASCAAVALGLSAGETNVHACGAEINKYVGELRYYVTTRTGDLVEELKAGGVVHGGIDLSDPYNPMVNKSLLTGFAPGSYRLVMEVPDKGKSTYINFRISGGLGIVSQDSKNIEKNDFYESGTVWTFNESAPAGARVPIYVTAIDGSDIDLLSAVGVAYSLDFDKDIIIYTSDNTENLNRAEFPRTIDSTGVDTLWVEMPIALMKSSKEKKSIAINASQVNLNFYVPQLFFVRKVVRDIDDKIESFTKVTGDPEKNSAGEPYFNWAHVSVELQMLVWNPIEESVCENCNMQLSVEKASEGLDVAIGKAQNGLVKVSVIAKKEFENDPAQFTVSADSLGIVQATYKNMFFRELPVPYVASAKLYDVHGKTFKDLKIPSPLHSKDMEYIDGIGDSLVVIYSRPFADNVDSLPNFICVNWDVENSYTLENYSFNSKLPRSKENVSYDVRTSVVACSDTIGRADILEAWENRENDSTLIFIGEFSKEIKTADSENNALISSFMTVGSKEMYQVIAIDERITDRIPPQIVKAEFKTASDFDDEIIFNFSEPVALNPEINGKQVLDFYMNSAEKISSKKYPFDESRHKVISSIETPKFNGNHIAVFYHSVSLNKKLLSPQVGDYVRMASYALLDSAGNSVAQESSQKSPWVAIEGTPRNGLKKLKSFSDFLEGVVREKALLKVSRRKLEIEIDISSPFVVLDMQGRVMSTGETLKGVTTVQLPSAGKYLVQVGKQQEIVEVK